ncbi:poly polymerase catalytic domain-containing protein [Penicillium waksmanii]|uniref:poly polymerase catalytic domain-containing protein n=1 Tax=Penicillium waksmanii TaxID=69791 RepID=UPI0025491076|nr:poly polymerase catalytic domain-containing protein [Penicillium waksmanii]KAJ5994981.1 poly polymerase catalytic domain-containing protein [Penicillium waksmanii]
MTSPVPFLANLTIAVSGHLSNGFVHSDVQRLTERYGGKFEDLDIAACTHLVASQRAVDLEFKKVQEASVTEDLQIVSQDWFFQSVEKEMLLATKKFLLRIPFQKKRSKASEKPSVKKEIDNTKVEKKTPEKSQEKPPAKPPAKPAAKASEIPHEKPLVKAYPKTHEKINEKEQELNAVIDDDHVGPKTDLVVWLDENNLIWDAILIKDSSSVNSKGAVTAYIPDMERLQLLYNLKTKDFHFGAHGMGTTQDSKSPHAKFERYFQDKTGLSWENRWDDPKEGKYVFVPRIFEDVEMEDTFFPGDGKDSLDLSTTQLPSAVYEVLGVIFDHDQKAHIEASIKNVSGGRLTRQPWRVRVTLRAAQSLLERISEMTLDKFQRSDDTRAKLLSILGKSYLALMWHSDLDAPPKWDLPARSKDKNWVKRERAALGLLNNLSFALDLMENSTKVSKNQILNRAYRGLGLASMTPVKAGTAEYKALASYLITSSVPSAHGFSVQPVNIFKIKREGEKERFQQYQKSHSTLVGDRRLLFHGSSAVNWIGILSQGLRSDAQTRVTPESPMRGIYFADVSSKSAEFCRYVPGDPDSCMLICEVEVGKKPQPCNVAPLGDIKAMHNQGHISYFAAGKTDFNKWCDAGAVNSSLAGVQMPDTPSGRSKSKIDPKSMLVTAGYGHHRHNEWVVYDPAQIRQRYFVQFTTA